MRVVGSDPDEWIKGGELVAKFLRGEVAGAGGDVTFTPSETEGYNEGDVGWAATKLTISLSDGKRILPRWTVSSFARTAGSSCRRTRRSLSPTTRSAGPTPEDPPLARRRPEPS